MNVIAINGSPRKDGNTFRALGIVAAELEREGITVEIIQAGSAAIRGCTACGACARAKNERCVQDDGLVNEAIQKMKAADGILLGSPVHFAGMSAVMKCFLDRAFYVAGSNGGLFRHKVGAAAVALRRSGGVAAYDQLNHYLAYAELLLPAGNYWPVIHGAAAGEAERDEEGVQIMRLLGRNMAWLLKLKAAGAAIPPPAPEAKVRTNFIR